MGRAGRRARFRCVPAQGGMGSGRSAGEVSVRPRPGRPRGTPLQGRGYWWDAGWADQGRTAGRFRCVPAQGAHEGRPYRGRGYWWDAGWADQGRTAGEVSASPPRAPTRDAPTGVVDIGGDAGWADQGRTAPVEVCWGQAPALHFAPASVGCRCCPYPHPTGDSRIAPTGRPDCRWEIGQKSG